MIGWFMALLLLEKGFAVDIWEKRVDHQSRTSYGISWDFVKHPSLAGDLFLASPALAQLHVPHSSGHSSKGQDSMRGPRLHELFQVRQSRGTSFTKIAELQRFFEQQARTKFKHHCHLRIAEVIDVQSQIINLYAPYGGTRGILLASGRNTKVLEPNMP